MTVEKFIEKHEGRKNKVYKCTAGKNTIGVGHNIDAKGLPEYTQDWLDAHGWITEEMIDDLLNDDIVDAIDDCNKLYPNFDEFTENRQMALIDFLFNVGLGTARSFVTTNNLINSGQWEKAAENLLKSKYAKQVKGRSKEVAELLRRG